MRNDLTQIAVILDRSGSMQTIKSATEEAFNSFIENQKKDPNDVNLLFVEFDSLAPHEIVFDGDAKTAPKIELFPRGGTPLHDAMGWTITELGKRLAALDESQRPSKVLVVIVTDGQENSSKEYNHETVSQLIKQQSEVYNWQFVFLAANQDAVLTAKTYNIYIQNAMTYNANPNSVRAMAASLSSATDIWKFSDPGANYNGFSEEDRKKATQ